MDKKQLVINQFLALQNSLIKRQEHQTRKINAKRALIKFLMPDISIYSNHNNYKQKYKAIPNKSLQEYSIDDIRFENADFILESMAIDQFLKNRIILTIHSTYQNTNNKSKVPSNAILHSELKLDVYGIYDIKKIHNQIIAKCPNNHHRYQLPFLIEDNGKHSVNFLENTITDENGNILYKITNQNLIGGSYKKTNYNDTYDDEYHIRFNVFGNLDLAQTKFEKGILEYEGVQSNQELTIIVSEKYQDFMKQFNIDDYLIGIELDNLSQTTSNEVNIRLSYIDFFYMDRCLRYNLDKNKIEYKTLKPELQLYSMKKQNKMHEYRAIFDVNQYIDSNRYDKFEMYSNIFTLEEICDSLVKLDLDKREGVAIASGETIGVAQDNHNKQYNDKKNTIKKLLFKNLMKPKEITFKELVRKIQRSRQYTDSQLNTYKEIVSNNLFDGNTNNGTNAFSNHELEKIEKFLLMNSIEPIDFNCEDIFIPYLEQFNHIKCLSNVKYINNLLLSKYNKKARRLLKRLLTFKNYVLMFNPEIKDFYYSGLLMENSYTGDGKAIDNHFNHVFNAIRIIQQDYPNLIMNIMKYRKENAGLFPLIIHAKVKDINEGKTDLLSYENVDAGNQYLLNSKHQFKQLNKRKSPTLTKLYSCLLNYIYNYNHNQNWHYKIISNVDAMYDKCFEDSDNDYQEARKNILIDLFWKLIANKTLSIREIYAIIMEFGNVIYSSCSYGANEDNVEEILFHRNKEYLYNIITDYCYQQAVMAFESNENKNKIDKRSSVEVITRNNQIISATVRDLNIFNDFIKKIKKAPLSIQQMQEYINQSKWKNKLDFINHYDESVTLCLSKVNNKKDYLINLIRKDNPKFIIPIHSQLKLDKNSTINTVKRYITDYDKFYLTQQMIIDGGVKNYQYQIDIQEMNIDSIKITPILDSYELMKEGKQMEHCVYSFHEHCLRNKYIVFKITDNTKYEDMTDVITRLTLGIMIRLPDNNRYSDKDYIKRNNDERSDREHGKGKAQKNENLAIKPTYNDLYFRFSQCYGYKNRFISNNEQQEKINIAINKLIYQLNKQLIENFYAEKRDMDSEQVAA